MSVSSHKYRPDIDGLRAIAVLPVMLYHFGFLYISGVPVAPGGYVGVDVFFVISGYLITGIIYDEMSSGRYSLAAFYARRVARIFPALILVYVVTLLGAIHYLLASEVESLRDSLWASLLFSSNIFFWMSSGYFDAGLQGSPLLHTWSLSVEEQFYVIFPFIIYALRSAPRRVMLTAIGVMCLASFVYAQHLVATGSSTPFYWVHTRAWELGLGAILAISKGSIQGGRAIRNVLGSAGLAMIVLSVILYDSHIPFPGVAALPPALGAALVIWGGATPGTYSARILTLWPFKWTGLLSYSLYLWHWPLVVLYKSDHVLNKPAGLALFVLCFVLAWVTWKYVEQPFRSQAVRSSPNGAVIIAGGVSFGCVALLAGATPYLHRLHWGSNEYVLAMEQYAATYDHDTPMRSGECFINSRYPEAKKLETGACLAIDKQRRNVLLVGDSHAAQLVQSLSSAYPDVNFLQATSAGCLPLVQNARLGSGACKRVMEKVFLEFLPSVRLDAVIMAGRWAASDVASVADTVKAISRSASKIVVVGRNVEYQAALPRLLARSQMTGDTDLPARQRSRVPAQVENAFLASKFGANATYFSMQNALCTPECRTVTGAGEPVNFDDNHLSTAGADEVVRAMRPYLF